MTLPALTVTARLAAEAEVRWTSSGMAVARLRLVANGRKYNKNTSQWEDADTWWGRGTLFGAKAEAAVDAGLTKGDLVMVTGRVKTTEWEDKQTGQKRSADEVTIDDIAKVIVPQKSSQPPAQGRGAPPDDPWAAANPTDAPPF